MQNIIRMDIKLGEIKSSLATLSVLFLFDSDCEDIAVVFLKFYGESCFYVNLMTD